MLYVPVVNGSRLFVRNLQHCGIQRRLTETLLEHANLMQQLVWNDRIIHPHTALIEHSHDRLILQQTFRKSHSLTRSRAGHFAIRQRAHVRNVVLEAALFEPALEAFAKEAVVKILAPKRTVFDAGFFE